MHMQSTKISCTGPAYYSTAVQTKSNSDAMFCLQSYQELRTDRSLVYLSYPQDRINTHVIYRFALAQVECIDLQS